MHLPILDFSNNYYNKQEGHDGPVALTCCSWIKATTCRCLMGIYIITQTLLMYSNIKFGSNIPFGLVVSEKMFCSWPFWCYVVVDQLRPLVMSLTLGILCSGELKNNIELTCYICNIANIITTISLSAQKVNCIDTYSNMLFTCLLVSFNKKILWRRLWSIFALHLALNCFSRYWTVFPPWYMSTDFRNL